MSREKCSPSAQCRSFFLGIQPNCLDVCSSCSPLWCPFRCRDGAHRFLRLQAGRLSTRRVAMHGPIGDCWPMAFFDCPRGHRVRKETHVLQHGPDLSGCYFPSNRASQEPDGHRQEMLPGDSRDSPPEALKLLVVSNSWRRNVPPSSTRLT